MLGAGLDLDNLPAPAQRNHDGNRPFAARRWVDTWSAGQGFATIRGLAAVSEIVDELEIGYREAMHRVLGLTSAKATWKSA